MSNINFTQQKTPETLKQYIADFNQRKTYIAQIISKFKQVENTTNKNLSAIYWDIEKNKDFESDLKIKSNECNKVVKNMQQCCNKFFAETYESTEFINDVEYKDTKRKCKPLKTCKNKFCAICCKIRSNKMFHETYNVIQTIKNSGIKYVPFHLTLTIKNPKYIDFDKHYKIMNDAFVLMFDKNQRQPKLEIRNYVLGWQAGREITQGIDAKESGTLHPHMHVLLLLHPDFVKKYGDNEEVLKAKALWEWNYCLKKQDPNFDEVTQLTFNKIKVDKNDKDHEAIAIAEVSKYPTKPSDLITMDADVLVNLYLSLKNARIITFGGIIKTVRAELKYEVKTVEDKFVNEELYKLKSVHLYNYFNCRYNKQNITKNDLLEHRVISNSLLVEYQHSKNKEKLESDYSSIEQYLRNDFTELNIFGIIKKYGENEKIKNEDISEIFEILNDLAVEDREQSKIIKAYNLQQSNLANFVNKFVGPLKLFVGPLPGAIF